MRSNSINNLKPCPECQGTRVVLKRRDVYGTYFYVCKKCGYSPEKAYSLSDAIEKWNNGKNKGDE